MVDSQTELIRTADMNIMRMRRRVIHALADAQERLMKNPARDRDILDKQLRHDLREAVTDRAVSLASDHYQTVSELSGVEEVQQEMSARAAHVTAFRDSVVNAVDDHRPWLAAVSVTTAEVVSPEKLPELRETQEWGLMQQASLEATVSCMPPSPKGWLAADGAGIKRVEEHDHDVETWRTADQPPAWDLSDAEPSTGHLLRKAVGERLKVSCERTDTSWVARDRALSKTYEFDALEVQMESVGVPEGGDLEEERFVPVPNHARMTATSDWWALRNGIPAEIDSFPAPNESVQQRADMRFKLPRPVWEASREYMGPAFDHVVIEGEHDVDVTVSAQQRVELRERAEDVQFRTVYEAEERIEFIQSGDDYGRDGGEAAQEVANERAVAERVAYQCSVVVGALNSAKPVTMHNSAPAPSVAPHLVPPPTPATAGVSADLNR